MKAHEVPYGTCSLVELVPSDAVSFDSSVALRREIAILFSESTGQSLLRAGPTAVSVIGRDKQAQAILARLRDRNLPRLGWVTATTPKSGPIEWIQVQVHEFPVQYSWPGDIDVGVDEKVVDVIRQKLGKSISATEIIEWLTERFVLIDQYSGSKVFISGSPTPESDHRRPFRMHGKGYAIDVQKTPEDKLLLTRLVEARRGASAEERRPIVPVQGNVRFCDSTIAGAFRGAARSQLDQLVEQAGSYLNVWREYNKLERDSVFRRARTLGWLSYSEAKRQADGRWRFRIQDSKQLDTALNLLRGAEDVELEAASQPPRELQDSSDSSSSGLATEGGATRSPRAFVGSFVGGDSGRYLDVLPTGDLDDREPPIPGVLFMSMSGDRRRLERRERAQASIALAECPMPQLGLLLEGSAVPERRRKTETALSAVVREVFGGDPTPRQIEAIRVALNTPDIALIQGPPGTGKTKTIAALQARLAELGEDGDLAGQTLLTSYQHDAVENAAARTLVFGLPAIKVGRKHGRTDDGDGFDRWRRERVDGIRADLARLPERPVSEVLRKVRSMSAAYHASRFSPTETTKMVRDIEDISRPYLSPSLLDRLLAIRQELSGKQDGGPTFQSDDRDLLLKAIRGLRVDAISFGDDGPRNATRVLHRLELLGACDGDALRLLTVASDWDADGEPAFLPELKALQEALLDRFSEQVAVGGPSRHGDLEEILPEIVNELFSRARESSGGEDAVLYEYLFDLENDVDAVRSAVRDYTVVLAATCQQAVGFQMSALKGERSVFANVIVDEAARANPLDLFIPMALAERRIILVGDHRQLPHILEPDVEGQLELSVSEETRLALRRSLFQRLFESMRQREAIDGIKRTVTLDVQYRMHPVLGGFVSDTFYAPYGEAFRSETPADQFEHALPGYQPHVAAWVDVPLSAGKEQGRQSKRRPAEGRWIAKELKSLATVRPDLSFGVISFYAGQVDGILAELEPLGIAEQLPDGSFRVADAWRETRGMDGHLKERIRVGTVDAFQGKEFDVVFLSMTRSNDLPITDNRSLRRKFGHLILENRLCVAMSRQQRLLIVVGDSGMLRGEVAEQSLAGLVAFRKLCEGRHGCIVQLDSPVLHFGPRMPAGVRYSQRKFLLWPALMYRVVAPEVRPRQINILQKAVLGMCRAGVTSPVRVGEKLRIHPDLAELIMKELLQRALIKPDGLPTAAGNEVFEDEALDMRPPVTGHVFQDPWSGELWPRFVQRLDYVELDRRDNGFPDLILGTKGKPRRERAFMCRPVDDAVPPSPDVRQILRATHRHKSALRNSESFEVPEDDEQMSLDVGTALQRISLVDDAPTPVFLTTFIYLAENENTGEWHACDPFGLGESPVLRRAIDREVAFFPRLREAVEALIGSSLDAQVEKQRGWIAELRELATSNLERKLTVNARDLPAFDELLQLEMAYLDAELLGDACPEQRLRDLLGAARRALESTFRSIASKFPPGDVWRHVYFKDKAGKDRPVQDQVYVSDVYKVCATNLGFATPLPEAVQRTRPNHLRAACFESGWRLRGAIVASMMAAVNNPLHPLVLAAKRRPELIEDLDAVASMAGEAIHAGDSIVELGAITPVIDSVYRSIAILGGIEVGEINQVEKGR